jgi:hypothetical protein
MHVMRFAKRLTANYKLVAISQSIFDKRNPSNKLHSLVRNPRSLVVYGKMV